MYKRHHLMGVHTLNIVADNVKRKVALNGSYNSSIYKKATKIDRII